ncbi:hypothetical protein OAH51_01715 [Verrucomicrobia bacterium]|nr:hypothetical protein [Verrucomicrobiota bacterium]
MKHLLLTTIAAVLVVGCEPKSYYSFDPSEPQPTEPPTVKAADISIRKAAGFSGNIESVK